MKQLKFDSEPQETLVLADRWGELSATIRYRDEKHITEGDEIECISSSTGEKIGTADVIHTKLVYLRRSLDVVNLNWAYYHINTLDHLVSEMNGYYDDDITRSSEVKVIILNPTIEM